VGGRDQLTDRDGLEKYAPMDCKHSGMLIRKEYRLTKAEVLYACPVAVLTHDQRTSVERPLLLSRQVF
jgi:hypothetical protein